MRYATRFIALSVFACSASAQDMPEWLEVSGELRARYESIDGQFRASAPDTSDQILLLRGLLKAEADLGKITLGGELQDTRSYLGDSDTPISNSVAANPFDILQAYVRFEDVPSVLGGDAASFTFGRQTIAISSQRQFHRVGYANVVQSYTGGHYQTTNSRGDEFHALYVVPIQRYPNSRPDLDDNKLHPDDEQWGRKYWGVHYRRADIMPNRAKGLWGELYAYGFNEDDTDQYPTVDRQQTALGGRLYRKPKKGQWDIDLEGAWRWGTRSESSAPDARELDIEAGLFFGALGYSFDAPWKPRLALEYYFASGDDDPNDDVYGTWDRISGARRGDLNNTSIHGPLTPVNLDAPGVRLEFKLNDRWDGRVYYHYAKLASPTESWLVAKLRDPSGQSGDFIGHTIDSRVRYWVVPDCLRLELGASALLYGEFAKNVPSGPEGDRTLLGYAALTYTF